MSNLAKASEMANSVHNVVGRFTLRFIDDQGAIEGRHLRLSHEIGSLILFAES